MTEVVVVLLLNNLLIETYGLQKVLLATTEVILIGGGWLRRRLNYEEPEVKEAVKKIVTLVNTVEFQSTFDSLKVTQINAALEFLTEEQIAIVEDVLKENRVIRHIIYFTISIARRKKRNLV